MKTDEDMKTNEKLIFDKLQKSVKGVEKKEGRYIFAQGPLKEGYFIIDGNLDYNTYCEIIKEAEKFKVGRPYNVFGNMEIYQDKKNINFFNTKSYIRELMKDKETHYITNSLSVVCCLDYIKNTGMKACEISETINSMGWKTIDKNGNCSVKGIDRGEGDSIVSRVTLGEKCVTERWVLKGKLPNNESVQNFLKQFDSENKKKNRVKKSAKVRI